MNSLVEEDEILRTKHATVRQISMFLYGGINEPQIDALLQQRSKPPPSDSTQFLSGFSVLRHTSGVSASHSEGPVVSKECRDLRQTSFGRLVKPVHDVWWFFLAQGFILGSNRLVRRTAQCSGCKKV